MSQPIRCDFCGKDCGSDRVKLKARGIRWFLGRTEEVDCCNDCWWDVVYLVADRVESRRNSAAHPGGSGE